MVRKIKCSNSPLIKKINNLELEAEKLKSDIQKTNNHHQLKKVSKIYEELENIFTELYNSRNEKIEHIWALYFSYEKEKALVNYYAGDEELEKSIETIKKMEVLLEKLIKELEEFLAEKNVEKYQKLLYLCKSYKKSDLALKNHYIGESFALNGDIDQAISYINLSIEQMEEYMNELKKDVTAEKFEPLHFTVEKCNLEARRGQARHILATALFQKDKELGIGECLNALNFYSKVLIENPTYEEGNRMYNFIKGKLKLMLEDTVNTGEWIGFYRNFKNNSNLISMMEKINKDLFNKIKNAEEDQFMIKIEGNVDNRGGNIGKGNSISNSGTIGDIIIEKNDEITAKIDEVIIEIRKLAEFTSEEKEYIIESLEEFKAKDDKKQAGKILAGVKSLCSKVPQIASFISNIINISSKI